MIGVMDAGEKSGGAWMAVFSYEIL